MVQTDKVAVVIGASKGVGFAVAHKLVNEGYKVVGTTRAPCQELEAAGVNVISDFDIATSDPEILNKALDDAEIDVLVIAAGNQYRDALDDVTRDVIRRQMEVNALGPVMVVQALRRRLKTGSKVALISSRMGSIASVSKTGGILYGYRMSKAALNIAGATMAEDLKEQQVAVVLVHPGVVFTDMLRTLREGRGVAADKIRDNSITPEESAEGIWSVIEQTSMDSTGQYWSAHPLERVEW